MSGTEVTCRDVDTGETESVTIRDDYVVIVDGNRRVDHVDVFHTTGTVVITIKRDGPSDGTQDEDGPA